jgi:hypothetical protein
MLGPKNDGKTLATNTKQERAQAQPFNQLIEKKGKQCEHLR